MARKKKLYNVLTYDMDAGDYTPATESGLETQSIDKNGVMLVLAQLAMMGYDCARGRKDDLDGFLFTDDPSIVVEEVVESAPACD